MLSTTPSALPGARALDAADSPRERSVDATKPGRRGWRTVVLAAAVAASGVSLTACFPLAVGGTAVGALVATDRRTLGMQAEDRAIELKARGRIGDLIREFGGIGLVSYNRKVLLYGQVPDADTKRRAGEIAAQVENVKSVENELLLAARAGLSTHVNDAGITARVKAAFVGARELQANAFKVVTEAGTVYLLGIVTRAEGDSGARIASEASGVKKVVTVFEYVTEEELARIGLHEATGSDARKPAGR